MVLNHIPTTVFSYLLIGYLCTKSPWMLTVHQVVPDLACTFLCFYFFLLISILFYANVSDF